MFEKARNEGNFDALSFYQSQKIDFTIYASECVLLGCKENVLRDGILTLKECMVNVYRNSLKDDAAGFYIGMMLGDKSLLSERTKDLFAVGGISHILAISGLHISMIGKGFYSKLRKWKIGFLTAGVLAGLVLLAYCYMVGSGMSVVRAVGMMLLFFLSQFLGRSYDMLNSLGVMIIYLLWDNPFLIEYSGFQFSVAALIGVGFVGKIISQNIEKGKGKGLCLQRNVRIPAGKVNWNLIVNYISEIRRKWISSLWMSMGITLTTLPVAASCYFEIPIYSPLVNAVLLPLLTPIFTLAVVGGLIGCILPAIGKILLIPCGWLYAFYEYACEFVESLPFGSVITGKPELEVVVLYYMVLFIGCMIIKNLVDLKEEEVKKENGISESNDKTRFARELKLCKIEHLTLALCRLIISVICFFIIVYSKSLESEIIFLDVGQGDAIYIASEDGTTCFIDGGSSDVNKVGKYRILPFLKAHGVKKIDYWFVSHADADHTSGLLEVMESGYKIETLVISDKMPQDENQEYLRILAKQQEISVIQMKAGEIIQTVSGTQNDSFSFEGIRIQCLYPCGQGIDRNEQSMVLLVEFSDEAEKSTYKALFSGDISGKGEAELIQKGVLVDIDLYKAAHHGSKYSNSKAFLDVIQPEICVVSCGKGNSYGHPHRETIENMENIGADVVYTMESGQVVFRIPCKVR